MLKPFSRELRVGTLTELESSSQANIEHRIIGAESAVAGSSRRAIVGEMVVTIDIGSSQQIERMATVVADNRRYLEAR